MIDGFNYVRLIIFHSSHRHSAQEENPNGEVNINHHRPSFTSFLQWNHAGVVVFDLALFNDISRHHSSFTFVSSAVDRALGFFLLLSLPNALKAIRPRRVEEVKLTTRSRKLNWESSLCTTVRALPVSFRSFFLPALGRVASLERAFLGKTFSSPSLLLFLSPQPEPRIANKLPCLLCVSNPNKYFPFSVLFVRSLLFVCPS